MITLACTHYLRIFPSLYNMWTTSLIHKRNFRITQVTNVEVEDEGSCNSANVYCLFVKAARWHALIKSILQDHEDIASHCSIGPMFDRRHQKIFYIKVHTFLYKQQFDH